MGNCLRHQSSTTSFSDYDDHYWDDFSAAKSFEITSSSSSTKSKNNNNNIDWKTKTATTPTTEVKIKITKKQLAELLGKEMRVEQVLAQLLAQSRRHHHHGYDVNSLHRPWRPVLQSIPELD